MAKIKVKLYGLWQLQLGITNLDLEATEVDEVLVSLDEKFRTQIGKSQGKAHFKMEGSLKDNSVVLLNGISLRNLKDTRLKTGDVLHIFPPIGGG